MVDKNPPAITITSPAGGNPVYMLNQPAASNYSCSDGGSGVASCNRPGPSGGNRDTTSVDSKIFTVNASDRVGNTSSLSQVYTVSYNMCLFYDPARPVHSGSTLPVKFALCNFGGKDVSAPGITVAATQIQGATAFPVTAAGNANPGNLFRFDGTGTSAGYIFNLKTDGLPSGSYQLQFTVGGDPAMHAVPFLIK
jgi:hypothetical protein